jgi:hypothetical protein
MINIKTKINESEQSSNLQNATLHTATIGIACSIEITPNYPRNISNQDEVKDFLMSELKPLSDKGWSFYAQIGLDCDHEDGKLASKQLSKQQFLQSTPKGKETYLKNAAHSIYYADDGSAMYNEQGQTYFFYGSLEDFANEYFLGKTVPVKSSIYVGDRDDNGTITWHNDCAYEPDEIDDDEDGSCVFTKAQYETGLSQELDDRLKRADAFDLLDILIAYPQITNNVQAFAFIKERNKKLSSGEISI